MLCATLCCILLAGLLLPARVSGLLVFCCVAMVSACRFMLSYAPLSEAEINGLMPQLPMESVQLVGRVLDPPEYHAYRFRDLGTWVFSFGCEGMKTSDEWKKYRGRIRVRVTGVSAGQSFRQGERLHFCGTLRKRAFLGGDPVELHVAAESSAETDSGFKTLSSPPRFSLGILGQQLREQAALTLSNGIEKHPARLAVYKALLLGYRKAIPPEIHRQFKHTGTLHIFAISGLHVGMVGLLITIILKTIGIPRDRWGLVLLPLLLAYVVVTGMKSSALRATAMAAVYFLAPLFRRKPDIPTSIAFSALLLLAFQPLQILSAGFIFSFTVVSFIVMGFAVVPVEFIFFGEGWLRAIRSYVASLGVTSVAAFLASLPLTALFFGSFAPVALVGNLIVVPLTFGVVLSGWLSIFVSAMSEIFNHAALVFLGGLLGAVGMFARLPGAHATVPPPPLTALLFWYCGWIHFFVSARTSRHRTAAFVLI
ncbi:MAG: ComEC/Rec2 family competence protein, partial [Verrucomicrobiota bacterium]